MDWLENTIEGEIRKKVKLLRDNGFNTECLCHHEYIQCQFILDGEIKRLHDVLCMDGHQYPSLEVRFEKKNKEQ